MKYLHLFFPIIALVMAGTVVLYRIRETQHPTNAKRILLPPLGMSTGLIMFIYPPTHIPWLWAIGAFLIGMVLFAPPLIYTSQLVEREGSIYIKKTKALLLILVVLISIRMSLHNYIEQHISLFQTASLFFMLAFGMLLPWRVAMYIRYVNLQRKNKIKLEQLEHHNVSSD